MEIHASKSLFEIIFQIRHGKATGTCFALSIEEKQYLVTARHLFPGKSTGDSIQFSIWKDSDWVVLESTLKLPEQQGVDIAILELQTPIAPKHAVKTNQGLTIGTETFFFGFPFGLKQNSGGLNRGFPFALVKKAIISGTFGEKGAMGIFLDGHNNIGFSGGPIGYYDSKKKQIIILGVISGYVNSNREITTPYGKFPYKENSGLVMGYAISHAMRIIAAKSLTA